MRVTQSTNEVKGKIGALVDDHLGLRRKLEETVTSDASSSSLTDVSIGEDSGETTTEDADVSADPTIGEKEVIADDAVSGDDTTDDTSAGDTTVDVTSDGSIDETEGAVD